MNQCIVDMAGHPVAVTDQVLIENAGYGVALGLNHLQLSGLARRIR